MDIWMLSNLFQILDSSPPVLPVLPLYPASTYNLLKSGVVEFRVSLGFVSKFNLESSKLCFYCIGNAYIDLVELSMNTFCFAFNCVAEYKEID